MYNNSDQEYIQYKMLPLDSYTYVFQVEIYAIIVCAADLMEKWNENICIIAMRL